MLKSIISIIMPLEISTSGFQCYICNVCLYDLFDFAFMVVDILVFGDLHKYVFQ